MQNVTTAGMISCRTFQLLKTLLCLWQGIPLQPAKAAESIHGKGKFVLWGIIHFITWTWMSMVPTHSRPILPLYAYLLNIHSKWRSDLAKAETECFPIPDHSYFTYSESQKACTCLVDNVYLPLAHCTVKPVICTFSTAVNGSWQEGFSGSWDAANDTLILFFLKCLGFWVLKLYLNVY